MKFEKHSGRNSLFAGPRAFSIVTKVGRGTSRQSTIVVEFLPVGSAIPVIISVGGLFLGVALLQLLEDRRIVVFVAEKFLPLQGLTCANMASRSLAASSRSSEFPHLCCRHPLFLNRSSCRGNFPTSLLNGFDQGVQVEVSIAASFPQKPLPPQLLLEAFDLHGRNLTERHDSLALFSSCEPRCPSPPPS